MGAFYQFLGTQCQLDLYLRPISTTTLEIFEYLFRVLEYQRSP
jgi:hypothetical protein